MGHKVDVTLFDLPDPVLLVLKVGDMETWSMSGFLVVVSSGRAVEPHACLLRFLQVLKFSQQLPLFLQLLQLIIQLLLLFPGGKKYLRRDGVFLRTSEPTNSRNPLLCGQSFTQWELDWSILLLCESEGNSLFTCSLFLRCFPSRKSADRSPKKECWGSKLLASLTNLFSSTALNPPVSICSGMRRGGREGCGWGVRVWTGWRAFRD